MEANYTPKKHCILQVMVHTEMEIFVWWEDLTTGREEWRFTGMEYGELSVTLSGVPMILMLSADNSSTQKKVVSNFFKINSFLLFFLLKV